MSEEVKKLGAFPYVIGGGLSYIPLIGLFFGVVSIIWGLATDKKGGKKPGEVQRQEMFANKLIKEFCSLKTTIYVLVIFAIVFLLLLN